MSVKTVLAEIRIGKDYSDWLVHLNKRTYMIIRNKEELKLIELTENGDQTIAGSKAAIREWLKLNNLELSEALVARRPRRISA